MEHRLREFAAPQSLSPVPELRFPKIDVTCYFSTFPSHRRRFEKRHDGVPARRSRGLLSSCLISFLVSCPNRTPQEETVFTERSVAAPALWSLKAAETHVWCRCLCPRCRYMLKRSARSETKKNKKQNKTRAHVNTIHPSAPAVPAYSSRQISNGPWRGK